jgi:hypothetical protein
MGVFLVGLRLIDVAVQAGQVGDLHRACLR